MNSISKVFRLVFTEIRRASQSEDTMSFFHLVCLLLGLSGVDVADGKRRRRSLSGGSGNLQPDEDDDDSHVYNTEKLIIFFDDDCVTSEDEATVEFTSTRTTPFVNAIIPIMMFVC